MSTDQSEGMPGPSERMPMRNSSMTILVHTTSQFKINNGRSKGPHVMIALTHLLYWKC